MPKKKQNPAIVLVESTESPAAIRAKIPNKKLVEVDLWVRTPDTAKLEDIQIAARLCSCRRICVAVIEDEL